MILLRNQVKNGEESWILAKKAREAIDQVPIFYLPIYNLDGMLKMDFLVALHSELKY